VLLDYLVYIQNNYSEKTYNNVVAVLKIYVHLLKRRKLVECIGFLKDYRTISSPELRREKIAYSEEQRSKFLKIRPRWFHYFFSSLLCF